MPPLVRAGGDGRQWENYLRGRPGKRSHVVNVHRRTVKDARDHAIAAVPYVRPDKVQAGPGAPRLHIKLTRPADLKLYEVGGTTPSPVCAAPCDRVIDGRRARVRPGRPARRVGGIIGLALGGAALGTVRGWHVGADRGGDQRRRDTYGPSACTAQARSGA